MERPQPWLKGLEILHYNVSVAVVGTSHMRLLAVSAIVAIIAAGACVSPEEKQRRERAEVSKQIDQICSLPPAERDAALERLKTTSGVVLVCGNEKQKNKSEE